MKAPRRTCFACGAKIGHGETRCPSCGASYAAEDQRRKQETLRETEDTLLTSTFSLFWGIDVIVRLFWRYVWPGNARRLRRGAAEGPARSAPH